MIIWDSISCIPNVHSLLPKGYPFKNTFGYCTDGDYACLWAVERLPSKHYSVDFIFFYSLGTYVSLWNFDTIRASPMRPKWPKLASLAQKTL